MNKTEENLMKAFEGEGKARNKYDYFAKVAEKEGYHYIAKIFQETALNEMQHAKEEFKLLKGIGNTETNLKEAIEGEHYETSKMYPEFMKQAEKDGNKTAATLFKEVGEIEENHMKRYQKLLELVKKKMVWKRSTEIRWKCSKCGYIHVGKEPPVECPSCKHPREFYEPECMCFNDDCECCN
ncbi:MAG: ferritin family protein [Candidatus Nanoarchaeia archaeon]|nr:ferritin family protein [Candidatus Nanoarchaeia archaeon]